MLSIHFIDRIVLTGYNSQQLSLKHGLIGKALFFYKLASQFGELHFKEYAESLMQVLYDNISSYMPFTFMDGLAGIGWTIQYIISRQLEEGDANEILQELDNIIMEHDPMRIKDLSFESGLAGVVAYVRARLDNNNTTSSFDNIYLKSLHDACASKGIDISSSNYYLDNIYKKILMYYDSFSEKERMTWETGLLLLEDVRKTQDVLWEGVSSEQLDFESQIEKSDSPCAIIITQTSRAANYGIGTYVEQLAQCLLPAGWNVCIFELDCALKDVSFNINEGVGYYKLSQQGVKDNIREHNYAQFIIQHFQKKAGLVVCHFNFAIYPLMAKRLRSSLQAKTLFTLHFTSWSFDLSGDKEQLKQILIKQNDDREKYVYKTFQNEKSFMLEHCDRVIAIAQHSYDMIRDIYNIPENKISLICNGRASFKAVRSTYNRLLLRQKYGFKESDKLMVFCGRLDSIKGVVDLIDAFRVLSNKIENIRLVIIGEGNFKSCYKLADGLWNRITFTGFLTKERIMEFYEMADFGVVPSIHEEFGYVALEMMMAGLPIIANNTTGLANLTENGRYGLLYNHEKALEEDGFLAVAEKVISGQLIIPKADTKVLKEKYSIETFRKNILNIYSSL